MAVRAYYRRDLALAQLETALSLYFGGGHRSSIVTLAGAADEVFGKLLKAADGEPSLQSLIVAVTAIQVKLFGEADEPNLIADRANRARNTLKHWSPGEPEIVKFDLDTEACDMLNRAIDNY